MAWKVVIAHAEGEEHHADRLTAVLSEEGYEVAHRGTVLVGESFHEEASKALALGGPVVVCGTVKAAGTSWARLILRSVESRHADRVRIFPVRLEAAADLEALAGNVKVADCHRDFRAGIGELLATLRQHYPLDERSSERPIEDWADVSTSLSTYDDRVLERFRKDLRPHIRERYPDTLNARSFLRQTGLLGGDGSLTRAGILIVGARPDLVMPSARAACAHYEGTSRVGQPEIVPVLGPLPTLIRESLQFLTMRIRHREQQIPGVAELTIDYEYPMTAVREVLANAFCHRRYDDHARHVHVRLFVDRIEVASPGEWVGRTIQGGKRLDLGELVMESVRRNARLAHVLAWARLVEEEGSGVPRAVEDCRSIGARSPTVEQRDGYTVVSIWPRSEWPLLTRPGPAHQSVARPTPAYTDAVVQALSTRLEDARARAEKLRDSGVSLDPLNLEILELRRQLREGAQLRAGDALSDGRYLLIKRLGQGGFAVVWEAYDQTEQRRVAIKVLHQHLAGDPQRRERFFRGARVMVELQHPAVVRVFDPRGEDDGFCYFVMELVPGGNLRDAVLGKRVDAARRLPLILQVAEALAEAHGRRMVHRDIKPANILLDDKENAKLTDFDLVGAHDTTGGTRTGALGTVVYAAPECLEKPQEATARADVFGLGMTAIFCLSGHDLSMATFRDPAAAVTELDCAAAVRKVIEHAVEWEPDRRFADAAAMVVALRGALDGPATPVSDAEFRGFVDQRIPDVGEKHRQANQRNATDRWMPPDQRMPTSPPVSGGVSTENAVAAELAFKRGEAAMKRDQPGEAILEFQAACDLSPNDVDYAGMLAWAKFCAAGDKVGIGADTRRALERAVYKSPNPARTRFYLGRVERMLGRDKEALRHFQEVLDLKPNDADAASEVRAIEARLAAVSNKGDLFGGKR